MFRVLARRHIAVLEAFAASNVVVAFDFDGTLAPLVDVPDRATMPASTRRLLTAVARRYPVAVISGRARRDVSQRLGGVPVAHVTGSHGLEPWGQKPEVRLQVRTWVRRLADAFGDVSGLAIEYKGYSLTVHYRHVRGKAQIARAVRQLVRTLPGARVLGGIQSLALVPIDSPHKGVALQQVRRLVGCDTAIFVGDDETDEDAFGADVPERLLAIRVGLRRRSKARYCVMSQHEVDAVLRVLVRCRDSRRLPGRRAGVPAELLLPRGR